MLNVTFHGVRGSTPCHGPETAKYGGNTSCVAVQAEGQRPLLLDMGTGLRYFGKNFLATSPTPLDAVALVTHLHWDHIQGLPFFAPILQDGARRRKVCTLWRATRTQKKEAFASSQISKDFNFLSLV